MPTRYLIASGLIALGLFACLFEGYRHLTGASVSHYVVEAGGLMILLGVAPLLLALQGIGRKPQA